MRKIFHSSSNIIVIDSDIDKAFEPMHQSVMTKIENFVSKNELLKQLWNMVSIFLSFSIDRNTSIEK